VSLGFLQREQITRERMIPPQTRWTQVVYFSFSEISLHFFQSLRYGMGKIVPGVGSECASLQSVGDKTKELVCVFLHILIETLLDICLTTQARTASMSRKLTIQVLVY